MTHAPACSSRTFNRDAAHNKAKGEALKRNDEKWLASAKSQVKDQVRKKEAHGKAMYEKGKREAIARSRGVEDK